MSTDSQEGVRPKSPPNLPVMNTLMAADRTLDVVDAHVAFVAEFWVHHFQDPPGIAGTEGKFVVRAEVPRNAGLFLTAMGTFAMVMGTLEYWQTLRVLNQQRIFSRPRSPLIMAIIMSISGILLFVSILWKLL